LKKFFKMNSSEFVERVVDIYYEGSLREDLTQNSFDGLDISVESKVIAHFCTGFADAPLSKLLENGLLVEWLLFKKNLFADEEAGDMYYILLNVYSKIYEIN